jgi:hypothetical protein
MIKTSYERIFEVVDTLGAVPLPEGKFKYAVMKNSIKFNNVYKKYQEQTFDINLENCQVYEEGEKKGTIMKDEKGNFCFTKEGTKAKEKAVRALRTASDGVDFDPYYAALTDEVAKQLGVSVIEALAGIIIRDEDANAAIEKLLAEETKTKVEETPEAKLL